MRSTRLSDLRALAHCRATTTTSKKPCEPGGRASGVEGRRRHAWDHQDSLRTRASWSHQEFVAHSRHLEPPGIRYTTDCCATIEEFLVAARIKEAIDSHLPFPPRN